jgi:hypothetical protein
MGRRCLGALLGLGFSGFWLASLGSAEAADLTSLYPQYEMVAPAATSAVIAAEPRYGIFWPAFLATQDNSYEVRSGAFAHGFGGREKGSVDVNLEFLGPSLFKVPVEYSYFIPRPQVGVMLNTVGKTSYVYAGMVWTLNITKQIFLEPMFGGVYHNGKLETFEPDRVSLGCSFLFNTGLSVGYRVNERWTVLGTWQHISNAGTCFHNVGLNDYGIKVGYKF